MKLIVCINCDAAFTPVEGKMNMCDCGVSSGYIKDGEVYYGGSNARPVDVDISKLINNYEDFNANKSDEKKLKKDQINNDREFITKVIEYLNQEAGTSFIAKYPSSNATLILARRDELSVSIDDFFRVIKNKCLAWKGNDMEQYLRPKTLFNKTNFSNYLGEKQRSQPAANTTRKSFDGLADSVAAAKKDIIG